MGKSLPETYTGETGIDFLGVHLGPWFMSDTQCYQGRGGPTECRDLATESLCAGYAACEWKPVENRCVDASKCGLTAAEVTASSRCCGKPRTTDNALCSDCNSETNPEDCCITDPYMQQNCEFKAGSCIVRYDYKYAAISSGESCGSVCGPGWVAKEVGTPCHDALGY